MRGRTLVFLLVLAFVISPLSSAWAGRGCRLVSPAGADRLAYDNAELGLSFRFAVTERAIELNVVNRSATEVGILWQRSRIRGANGRQDSILTSLHPVKKRDAFSLKEEEPLILPPGDSCFRSLVPADNRIMSSLSVMGYEVKPLFGGNASSRGTLSLFLYLQVNGAERKLEFVFAQE